MEGRRQRRVSNRGWSGPGRGALHLISSAFARWLSDTNVLGITQPMLLTKELLMRTRLALVCLIVLIVPVLASAAPITFAFTGHVTAVIDPAGILAGSAFTPSTGAGITGTYTFDADAVGNSLGPGVMSYVVYNSPFGMQFEIAGTSFATAADPFGFLAINVFNDADLGSGPHDRYVVFTNPGPIPDFDVAQAIMEGATFNHLGTISDTNLPLTPPDFAQFDLLNEFTVSLHVGGVFAFVVGQIDSLDAGPDVPEPGSTALLGFGMSALAWRLRLRRRVR